MINKNLFVTVFCLLLVSPYSVAGEWVSDPISGCKVWSDDPTDDSDVVSWSGECEEEKASGHGVLAWFSEGGLLARYVGVLKAGKVDGVGLLTIRSEHGTGYDRYEAVFVEGEIEGEIVLDAATGDHFQGSMVQSVIEGYGSYIGANGDRYDGEFVNGMPEGPGFSEASGGELYNGMFKAGKRHGEGSLVEANGDRFEGEFVEGILQGWGSWQSSDGSRFDGQFEDGKPNGQGIYRAPNGDIYTGGFVNGFADGEMSVKMADGQKTSEVWENGEKVK